MDCSTDSDGTTDGEKIRLRRRILANRRRLSPEARDAFAAAVSPIVIDHLRNVSAVTVAAYSPVASEPGGPRLPWVLRDAGFRVLLPVLRADLDLDWAFFAGGAHRTERGLNEPTTQPLGVEAVAAADAVVVPALAVGPDGARLGRGGGSYDRALARVPATTPVIALLYDDESPLPVPSRDHDRPVTAVVTPTGIREVGHDET